MADFQSAPAFSVATATGASDSLRTWLIPQTSLVNGAVVVVRASVANPALMAVYLWDAASTTADDGNATIRPASIAIADPGRFVLVVVEGTAWTGVSLVGERTGSPVYNATLDALIAIGVLIDGGLTDNIRVDPATFASAVGGVFDFAPYQTLNNSFTDLVVLVQWSLQDGSDAGSETIEALAKNIGGVMSWETAPAVTTSRGTAPLSGTPSTLVFTGTTVETEVDSTAVATRWRSTVTSYANPWA